MANDDEISISPQASQGETVELGSNVELVSDGSGDLKVVASSAVDMNGNQINDSTGAVQMGSDLDANINDVTNVGALDTDSLNLTPVIDKTKTLSSGATEAYQLGTNIKPGDAYIVSVFPSNKPGNDVELEYKTRWNTFQLEIVVSETANAGGGDVRVTVWQLGV